MKSADLHEGEWYNIDVREWQGRGYDPKLRRRGLLEVKGPNGWHTFKVRMDEKDDSFKLDVKKIHSKSVYSATTDPRPQPGTEEYDEWCKAQILKGIKEAKEEQEREEIEETLSILESKFNAIIASKHPNNKKGKPTMMASHSVYSFRNSFTVEIRSVEAVRELNDIFDREFKRRINASS